MASNASSNNAPKINEANRVKAQNIRNKNTIQKQRRDNFNGGITKILGVVFVVILIAVLIRTISGSSNIPTFTGFLEMLTEVPSFDIPFLTGLAQNSGFLAEPWVILDGLRVFLFTIMQIIDVLIFFINGIINVLLYVVYFFRWLFVF